jgi:hypothetical protein
VPMLGQRLTADLGQSREIIHSLALHEGMFI